MSCYSDTDLAPGMSPYTSLSSLTGSNIYSQSLSLLHPTHGHHTMSPRYVGQYIVTILTPHHSRSLPSMVRPQLRSPSSLPRFSSLPKPGVETNDPEFQGHRSLGRMAVRLTYRADKAELLVG